jgi:membrane protein implicated in regulation of membrane protease activity
VWTGAALAVGLLEMASLDFVFSMIAGGALAAAVTAALGFSVPVQVVTFAVSSAVLLLTVRPSAKRGPPRARGGAHRTAPFVPTNVQALRGREARTLTEVTERDGTVKLAGETWSARTATPGQVIPAGQPVEVVSIDGATAVVSPQPPTDSSTSLSPADPWTKR